ncbi:flavodoxin family protein [Anaerosacchariphilus polymeriproducens]|uniref:Flavodoxin family protein n=1 Tax=Anaerosacchariphilus polymeriproducens TaxID=1812858 RepID=A0A371AVQ0_9FIRM|nr:NAD(P)H-dependent oxidoreductase [Anaerosacchariphilus polymeriproducens]RDU23658.1 flavodoxin family protein [Anaerosacchariphilus polymeriproducens]
MKIAVIIGSPRKKDSYMICKEVEQQLNDYQKEIEFDYIFLSEKNILDCKGCSICFQKSEKLCPCRGDDLDSIIKRLVSADAIIIVSPVYAYQVTGPLKRFIDRTSYFFHRQELCNKSALIVVTTDGGGSKQVYRYLKMILSGWGTNIIGNLQVISSMYFKDRKPKSAFGYDEYYHEKKHKQIVSISNLFYNSLTSTKIRIPTFYDIFIFNCLRSKTYTSSVDRTYWEEKGWINADYFYSVHLSPLKKLFGRVVKGFIHMAGKRYLKES